MFSKFTFLRTNVFLKDLVYGFDTWILNLLIKNQYKDLDIIFAQTEYQKEQLNIKYGLNSVIVKNSIRTLNYSNVKKEKIILWVGNFRKVKQPELFIELANKCYGSDWRFVMIGKNDRYIDITTLSDNKIEMIGELDFDETKLWIQKASILVNTSKTEGFSNTFLEAWASKTLVVSLNVDTDKLLSERGYGVFANSNFEKLVSELNRIMVNDVDQMVIESAFNYVNTEFSLINNTDIFEQNLLSL